MTQYSDDFIMPIRDAKTHQQNKNANNSFSESSTNIVKNTYYTNFSLSFMGELIGFIISPK